MAITFEQNDREERINVCAAIEYPLTGTNPVTKAVDTYGQEVTEVVPISRVGNDGTTDYILALSEDGRVAWGAKEE